MMPGRLEGICGFEQWDGCKINQYWFFMLAASEAINDLNNGLETTLPALLIAATTENATWDIFQLET